ncbi:MAG TPA: hypothetical protein VFG86_11400 [Chloroflexota bacterium]|jgi:hypothetical protein|nr:hypothetical protein [Chloroflexota bacterium]
MQLVANQQLVRNRVRLGLGFHLAALAVFALGLVISLQIDVTRDLPFLAWGAIVFGLVLYTVGQTQLRRFGPKHRQDEALGQAIRGLDERYKLYAFLSSSLPDYILVSPGGVHVLIVRTDAGDISVRRDVWTARSSRFGRLFGPGFSNPNADATKQLQRLRKLLTESGLDDVPSGAIIVFTNDQVRLRDEGCSLPIARLGTLEDVLRRLVGKGQNVALNQGRVRAVQKVFDDRMRAAKAWR